MTSPGHAWGRRGAVKIAGRAVHYRRSGPEGAPAVILLHGSPESASALYGVAAALADRFDVIGFDTPGNGLSEPLSTPDPDAADYARHLLAFMDSFGVDRAGLYGFHTGAGTAMEAAILAPDRVSALALDGYPVWTDEERAALLDTYCVVYEPVWDGSHLARIWARLDEQLIFFPWNETRLEARMNLPATPMEVRLRRLRDWLTAWESYPAPYRAAFKREGARGPDRIKAPALIGALGRDPLSAHLTRLDAVAPGVRLVNWGADRDRALADIGAHFAAHSGAPASADDPCDPDILSSLARPAPRYNWTPDDHGGFLLKLWRDARMEQIAKAPNQAALNAGLEPLALQAQVLAAIQAETGL